MELEKRIYKNEAYICVVAGGFSSEREISLKSGNAVFSALKSAGFQVELYDVKSPNIDINYLKKFDLIFIAMHGKFGEDGKLQKILEEAEILFTGSKSKASSLAMDKIKTKEILISNNIPTPPFKILNEREDATFDQIKSELGEIIFIKPAEEGSSYGISKIENTEEFSLGIKKGFEYSNRILLEQGIKGQELTVGILGNTPLPVILLKPAHDFFDFDSKYKDGSTKYIVNPDEIMEEKKKEAQSLGLNAHKALGCSGVSRVDILMDDKGNLFVIEINTIPGLTERSLLPMAANRIGINFVELCKKLMLYSI